MTTTERNNSKKRLKMAILLVNGTFNYKDNLWLKLSVGNIIRYTSPHTKYKIFIWNHDYDNTAVNDYLNSVADFVEVINEKTFNAKEYTAIACEVDGTRSDCFAGGYHNHRGALQILYEYTTDRYDADVIFTFDSDAWPIRNNWELPLLYRLDRDVKLAGIWRDELSIVIEPYVHPSCLGIKTETIHNLNLRFDQEPIFRKEDTLSHFTRAVVDRFGDDAILPLKRTNRSEYHSVFNGVYGGYLYHHHLGTRYMDGTLKEARTYGWQERGESPAYNKFILDGATQRVFENTDDFIDELAYGDLAFSCKLYSAFLRNCAGPDSYARLFDEARQVRSQDLMKSYYILGLIGKHFASDREFLLYYADVCRSLGFCGEAETYRDILAAKYGQVGLKECIGEQTGCDRVIKAGDSHYRAYVGPPEEYDIIGAMTFNLLTTIGLRENHRLLDIGCGSLRSGRLFITYLNESRYTGIEPNEWLVNEGIRLETGNDLIRIKKPRFLFAGDPAVLPEGTTFDFAVAQSVLSHGTLEFIERWLTGLFPHICSTGALLATFRQGDHDFYHEKGITDADFTAEGWLYPKCPTYRIETIEKIAVRCGYKFRILDWRHPRQTWAIFARENYDLSWFDHRPLTWNTMIERGASNT